MAAVAMGQLGRPKRSSAQTGAVNLYSSRHYDTDEALYEGFTEQTGLEVNLVEASADELIERIQSEGANSPADVLITVDAGRLWRATEAGILAPISSPVLEASVPENLRHPDGQWFGLSKRARIIAYNRDNVNPAELSTYEDLADPKWRDRILVRSSNNIYNQSLVGAMIAAHGVEETEEWVRGLVANFARPPEGNDTAQIRAAAAGVGDVAIVNHYYVARLMESDDPADRAVAEQVGVFFPNQRGRGTHVNISGGGVVASAPNREGAIAFLEYLVTPEAQRIFADGNNEYPVVDAVPPSDVVASLGDFKEDDVSAAVFGRNNPTALMICDRAGWQ
jgi:iron(III) transport system substrate-binding protein